MLSSKHDRASRAVLWGLGWFLAGQLALFALCRLPVSLLRDPIFATRMAHVREHQTAEPPKVVLCLGSSRMQCGVRARLLDAEMDHRVFVANWSGGGWGFFRALLSWDRLERNAPLPDLVVIDVLPTMFNGNYSSGEERPECLPSHELDAVDADLVRRYYPGSQDIGGWFESRPGRQEVHEERLLAQLLPAYGFRSSIRQILAPRLDGKFLRSIEDVRQDFLWQVDPGKHSTALEHARQEYQRNLRNFTIGGTGKLALEELLGRVRTRGVPAVLVSMPEGPAFRSWYPATTQIQVREYLEQLQQEYGVAVVDASTWLDDERHFIDSHHLTPDGAALFSRRLAREVILPTLGKGK